MTPIEAAWVAGLYEGEGSVYLYKARRYSHIRIQLSSTDEDVVRKLHAITGVGSVYCIPPRKGREDHKQAWEWKTGAIFEIIQIWTAMLPHLGQRRAARLQEVFDEYINCLMEHDRVRTAIKWQSKAPIVPIAK